MTLNNHFNVHTQDFEDRPKPKMWLLKPDYTRIERMDGVTKLQGGFKSNNLNTLSAQISPFVFDQVSHKQKRNFIFDLMRNKYLIEFQYNGFKDYFVIDEIKNVSNDSDSITFSAESVASELSKKSANEIELLGSTIRTMMTKVCEAYAPLWSVDYIDPKLAEVKRELTQQNTTVMGIIDEINNLFDSVVRFNNKDRKISFYHKDNVGVNRGLRVRENSYLKSFEDSLVTKDIITRLYPVGSNGLTIQSVNPAGTDYIEDFSYFMSPFKRDAKGNVLQHSDYMSDALCHALLDYQEYYNSKKDEAEEYTKRYTGILTEYTQESFSLNQLSATLQRLQDKVELLKPKSEYIDLGVRTSNFDFYTPKSSYYLLMIQNNGNLARIKFGGQTFDVPANDWLYLKIDTGDFKDAEKFEEKLKYTVEVISTDVKLHPILVRSSLVDFEEEDDKKIEEKYNLPKYELLVADQAKVVGAIEKRMKIYEDEKSSLIKSMNPKSFLPDKLYKERETYVYGGIWQEDNHTVAKDLYDDAIKQLGKQKKLNRSITLGLVNFTQSLEHKRDWDKLNVGDVITFSNKMFNKKLKAYIVELNMSFDDNNVNVVISDIIDYVDESTKVAELIATASSTSNQVGYHKEQIKAQQGKMTAMSQLIEAEWDANKKRIMAGNETVDIGAHGIKVISNENPDEYVAIVGGVIALTRDGGNTFKTGVTPEGVNAETLIGKIFIGENLELQNESGSVRFNKNGFFADVNSFTLTTNDGKEDYFDKLKREMQDDAKLEVDRLKQSLEMQIDEVKNEATDVENVIDLAITNFQDAFKDGIVSDVEKKMITETLAQLEKENNEYIIEIDKALNSPYILSDDIVQLNEYKESYTSMYVTMVEDINESISDTLVTVEESQRINASIINFRQGIQEVLAFLKEVMSRNIENQIQKKVTESYNYTDRMKDDIKDELKDLQNAMDKVNDTVLDAMKDNVFDTIEIENIKTMLMILKSEQEDIVNRYDSTYANPYLSAEVKAVLKQKKDNLTTKFNEFNTYVNLMIADGISDDTERVNYELKYKNLVEAQTEFMTQYDNAVIAIANHYTDTKEGQLTANIEGLREEVTNDIKDVRDNMSELTTVLNQSFEDGIITSTELTRLNMHLDMLDREYMDIEQRYAEISNNQFFPTADKTALGAKRSPYISAHSTLRQTITNVISDSKVDTTEKTTVKQKIDAYNTAFANYTTAIQSALNTIARNLASDVASTKVEEFNPILNELSTNLSAIQKQVDNAIDTYYYSYDPTLSNIPTSEWIDDKTKESHVGDLFLNIKTGVAYRFLQDGTKFIWQRIEDQAISDALNRAQGAMDLADNKRRVFVNTPKPPYDVGDMWMQGANGDILVCFTPKTATQVYNSADFVKAHKYTDDTKANEALNQLNTFKQTTNTDINNLKSKTDLFQKDVVDAFDDRVISMSEASAIKSRFYSVIDVKKRLENKYFTLSQNPDLFGNPKSNLTTAYNNLISKFNTLDSTINSAISDNKITTQENTNTKTAFDDFVNAIQNIEFAFDNAFNAIITNIAQAKAQEVQDRFDTWKNSEFTVTSEQIVQRVSESNWKDTYFPQVQSKIDEIQVGGTNLLLDSLNTRFMPNSTGTGTAVQNADSSWTITPAEDKYVSLYFYFKYLNKTLTSRPLQKDVYYTFSIDVKSEVDAQIELGINSPAIEQYNSVGKFSYTNVKANEYKRISFTFKFVQDIDSMPIIMRYPSSAVGKKLTYTNVKIEQGLYYTDYAPAPEDLLAKIEKAKNDAAAASKAYADAQDALSKTQAQAYADGKVSAEEQRAINDAQAKLQAAKSYAEEKAASAQNASIEYSDSLIKNLSVGGTNLLRSSTQKYLTLDILTSYATGIEVVDGKNAIKFNNSNNIVYLNGSHYSIEEGQEYTFSFYAKASEPLNFTRGIYINPDNTGFIKEAAITTEWKRYNFTFTGKGSKPLAIHMYPEIKNADGTYKTFYITDWQLEKGNVLTDAKPSSYDIEDGIVKAQTAATAAAKAYSDAQDALRKTEAQAYADGKVSTEEQRAINDAKAKLDEAKTFAETKKTEVQNALNARIDGLSVGGRNLVEGTASMKKAIDQTNPSYNQYFTFDITSAHPKLQLGDTITISFDVQMERGDYLAVYDSNNNFDYYFGIRTFNKIGTQKQRLKITVPLVPAIKTSPTWLLAFYNNNNGDRFTIENLKVEKGNLASEWTAAPEDLENKVTEQGTKIASATTFIDQNKDRILNAATKTEVEGQLSKVTTNQTSYAVTTTTGNVLTEFYGTPFSDNYTYEVTAKNKTLASENIASAVFVSKGVNKGFELVELENKTTTGTNPRFILNAQGRPAISVYTASGVQDIDVIYTKYMGTYSTINTAKSMIEQKADSINLEVEKINNSLTPRNLISNSDFENKFDSWSEITPNIYIEDVNERAFSLGKNLLANGESQSRYNGKGTGSNRVSFKFMKSLEVGKTYTLSFDYTIQSGTNSAKVIDILPYYYPVQGTANSKIIRANVREDKRNFITFTCLEPSNEILIYGAGKDTAENPTCQPLYERVTLTEGTEPLEWENNSVKNIVGMKYLTNINYPSINGAYLPVGADKDLKVGDVLTFSTYVYVPEKSRGAITGAPYFEVCGYNTVNQTTNSTIGSLKILPANLVYNEWVRYEIKITIPSTTSNGATKYIRPVLRFDGTNQAVNSNCIFYYALPQLERGAGATEWGLSKEDVMSSKRIASRITLNPDSIEMISRNLVINTDKVAISNTNGNFTMKNDELLVSNADGSNTVRISSNGINIKKDGVDKIIDGLDTGSANVNAFQPRHASFSKVPTNGDTTYSGLHVKEPNNYTYSDVYYYGLGERTMGEKEGTLIGLNKDCGRINRYVYYHEKRYLKIKLHYQATNMTGYFHVTDISGSKEFRVEKLSPSTSWNYNDLIVDLGKPTNSFKTLELSIGSTGGSVNATDKVAFRIMSMQLVNFQ